MKSELRACLTLFGLLTVVTGVLYPVLVTLVAQGVFPHQANGSVIERDGKVVGSELIGQPFFDGPEGNEAAIKRARLYFWSRPSATTPPYDGGSSSGQNWGPTNPDHLKAVADRVAAMKKAHPDQSDRPVPIDLVTASASGLDPHISPAAAEYQVKRVADARGMSEHDVRKYVGKHTDGRLLGILGEPRVNVLRLNLELDTARGK